MPDSTSDTNKASPPDESVASIARKLGPASWLGVGALVLPPVGGILILVYANPIGEWLRAQDAMGPVVYALAFALLAGLALLPTYAQAIVGGYAFGTVVGIPAALAGFTGGAILGYEIARRASGDRVTAVLAEHPKWNLVYRALVNEQHPLKTLLLVTLVRVPPNSPFALTNLVLAAVKVPRWIYVVGTAVGMLPRTAAAVVIGAGIGELTKESIGQAKGEIPVWAMIGVTIAVVVVVGLVANRMVKRYVREHAGEADVVRAQNAD